MKGKKTGGRKAGVPNKVTTEIRNWVHTFLSDNREAFEADFAKIDPDRRVQIYERLLQYSIPKMQSIGIESEYRELEKLLQSAPNEAVEAIAAKIVELNKKSNNE